MLLSNNIKRTKNPICKDKYDFLNDYIIFATIFHLSNSCYNLLTI